MEFVLWRAEIRIGSRSPEKTRLRFNLQVYTRCHSRGARSVTPERWQMVRGILQSAMEMRPDERGAFLDRECASDPSLRKDVEEYLSIDGKLDPDFLDAPAAQQVALPASTATGTTMLAAGIRLGPYE